MIAGTVTPIILNRSQRIFLFHLLLEKCSMSRRTFWGAIALTALWAALPTVSQAQLLHQWTFNGNANDSVGNANAGLWNGASIVGGRLSIDGVNDYARTNLIDNAIGTKTLVAWVSLDNLAQRSGSALTLQNSAGSLFDGIVYGERTAGQWMSGSNGFVRTPVSNGGVSETVTNPGEVMIAITYAADNSITLYRNGVLYGSSYTQGTLQNYAANASDVLLGWRHLGSGPNPGTLAGNDPFLGGFVNEARVYSGVLNATQIADLYSAGPATDANPMPTPIHRWSFNDGTANDSIGTAHGSLLNGASVSGGQLVLDGINDYVRTSAINSTVTPKTLMAWVTLSNLSQRSGSALTLENPTGGDVFDGIVFGEQTAGQWMNGSNGFTRTPAGNGGALESSLNEIMMAIVYDGDRISLYRNGTLYATYTDPDSPVTYVGGIADVLLGLRHEDASGAAGTALGNDPFLAGMINEARLYDAALTADEIALLFSLGPNALVVPEPSSVGIWSLVLMILSLLVWKRRVQVAH
jgi:hypothetical protein